MKFGITLPIRLSLEARDNVEIAKTAEDLGIDSIWVSDHVVMPERHLGSFSEVFYDPFILLSYIAAQTSKYNSWHKRYNSSIQKPCCCGKDDFNFGCLI